MVNILTEIETYSNIQQKSIFRDSEGGSVKVYYGTEEDIEDFIDINSVEMHEKVSEGPVHCFMLMNKGVAEYTGIIALYDWFNDTPFYREHYDAISTELLNNDVNKLGEIERYLYNLTEFFILSQKNENSLLELFSTDLLVSLDMASVCKIVNHLKTIKGASLKDVLFALDNFKQDVREELVEKKEKELIDTAIDSIIGIVGFSYDHFTMVVRQVLFQGGDDAEERIKTHADSLVSLYYQRV